MEGGLGPCSCSRSWSCPAVLALLKLQCGLAAAVLAGPHTRLGVEWPQGWVLRGKGQSLGEVWKRLLSPPWDVQESAGKTSITQQLAAGAAYRQASRLLRAPAPAAALPSRQQSLWPSASDSKGRGGGRGRLQGDQEIFLIPLTKRSGSCAQFRALIIPNP